jgi:hemolysin-activating ACP:hemolysin acyltransferase
VSKLASRRQKSRALQSTPCAAKRPAQDRRSWRSLSPEKPRRGNACWRREIRLLAVLGRLKDCARVYTNRIFLRREAFLRLRTRIFFALCQGYEQVHARKNAVKSSREKRCLAQSSRLPQVDTPTGKNIWIPDAKLRWGSSLPARARPRTGSDRPRTQVKCTVCRRLQEASQPRWFLPWCLLSPE